MKQYDVCRARMIEEVERVIQAIENYDKFVPHELFSVKGELVVFADTESFVLSLRSLCEFLNIAEQYQGLRTCHLIKRIRETEFCVEKDVKGKELMNQKDWRALSDRDICYLYGLLETSKNKK